MGGTSPRYCVNSCDRPTEAYRRERRCGGNGDWAFVLTETDPLYKSFSAIAPRHAELQVADATAHVLTEEALEKPLARIEKPGLLGDKKAFLLAVDHAIGMGSYSGHMTMLVKVQNRHLSGLAR